MQHFRSLEEVNLQNVWLTIGSFDGVHRGHQAIAAYLTAGAHAAGVPAVVLTFHPHPAVILRNRSGSYYLTSPDERASILGDLGVDVIITHPFTRAVANTSAGDFLKEIQRHMRPSHVLVGEDFALGHDREGGLTELARLGEELGYTLTSLSPIRNDQDVISSSRIRSALAEGNVTYANNMLGRAFQINGKVIPGDGRGRTLGIPTANLDIWPQRALPKSGVYACYAHVEGAAWHSVVNIGVRPTFDPEDSDQHVEAHLLDFNQDMYGKQLALDFVARIRDEQRFSSVEALVDQIHQDIKKANMQLKNN